MRVSACCTAGTLLLIFGACGGEGSNQGEQSSPDAPRIVDLGTNLSVMEPEHRLVVTATVVDPQGPENIQGGSLKSSDEALTYRGFIDDGSGTFTVELDWNELHDTEPIHGFREATRTFVAVFFDNEGHSTWRSFDITLRCQGDTSACDGVCVDQESDAANCGACGTICGGDCVEGRCTQRVCHAADGSSCNEICVAAGLVCTFDADPTAGCPDGGNGIEYYLDAECTDHDGGTGPSCTKTYGPSEFLSAITCCCH